MCQISEDCLQLFTDRAFVTDAFQEQISPDSTFGWQWWRDWLGLGGQAVVGAIRICGGYDVFGGQYCEVPVLFQHQEWEVGHCCGWLKLPL